MAAQDSVNQLKEFNANAKTKQDSLKAKFESAMQKEWKSRPENMKEDFRSELKELPSKEVMVPVKKKPLKSMSKGSMKMERY